MTKISLDEVKKLARLARIAINEEEAKKFQKEIGAILGYVEQLQSVDTDNIEPTSQVTGLVNVTRPDEVIDYAVDHTKLLENAPDTQDGYIKVRRVL